MMLWNEELADRGGEQSAPTLQTVLAMAIRLQRLSGSRDAIKNENETSP